MFDFINAINTLYREDPFVIAVFGSVSNYYNKLVGLIQEVEDQFFFDTLTICLPWYEKWKKITPKETQTLDDRRATVAARIKSKGHNSVAKLQAVADSWDRGETSIRFVGGKFRVTFNSILGVPDDIETLKEALEEIKPAHLPIEYQYRYLLIEDIHEVLTIEQMEQIELDDFAFGVM